MIHPDVVGNMLIPLTYPVRIFTSFQNYLILKIKEYENSLREVKEHNNKIELYYNAYEKLIETEFEDLEETDLAYLNFLYDEGIAKTVMPMMMTGHSRSSTKKKILIA